MLIDGWRADLIIGIQPVIGHAIYRSCFYLKTGLTTYSTMPLEEARNLLLEYLSRDTPSTGE